MLPGTVRTSDGSERIGVFGGTFDPVHVAHLVAAVEARRALSLDRVILVPAGDPWQKRGSVAAPAADRLAMVEAAVEGIDGLEVSPLEVERDGPSYTYQTLEALSGRRRDAVPHRRGRRGRHHAAPGWGSSACPGWPPWWWCDRAGDRPAAGGPPAGWPCERVSIPRLDVSSTDLRARAARGWPLDGLVPPGAIRVIAERGLYRS